jgi:gliding motility-associated-like protein
MLSGTFIANGTENYLTIGNFTDSIVADTFRVFPFDSDAPDYSSYYYIDDVKLYETDTIITTQICDGYLPNIFTPNADNVNDVLSFTTCSKIIKTTIYNRWGNVIFATDKVNYFWDGRTTSGELCMDGNYFYVIETKEKNYKGFVQLVR